MYGGSAITLSESGDAWEITVIWHGRCPCVILSLEGDVVVGVRPLLTS